MSAITWQTLTDEQRVVLGFLCYGMIPKHQRLFTPSRFRFLCEHGLAYAAPIEYDPGKLANNDALPLIFDDDDQLVTWCEFKATPTDAGLELCRANWTYEDFTQTLNRLAGGAR